MAPKSNLNPLCQVDFASGSGLIRFPPEGRVIAPDSGLGDQGAEILRDQPQGTPVSLPRGTRVPIMGFHQTPNRSEAGRLVVYGDSNCVDSAHMTTNCFWMMDAILEYSGMGKLPKVESTDAHFIRF